MLSSQQKEHLHSLLIDEKQRLEHELTLHDGRFSQSENEDVGELSGYDNHPADMGSALEEREKNMAMHDFLQKELGDVNRALQAMKDGTYGICIISGEEIPYERLEAVPTTQYCIQHAPNHLPEDRPVEEKVLAQTAQNYDLGVEQDAEDTWQAVERYGTSDTPSDFDEDIQSYNDTYIHHNENVGYVEEWENIIATDMYGKNRHVVPTQAHKEFESMLDEYEWRMLQGELESESDWYD